MKEFLDKAKDLTFEERGKLLVDTASDIIDAHEQLAQEGQTPAPQENAPVYYHFVAFIEKDGMLYELGMCHYNIINIDIDFFLVNRKLIVYC